jgi:DNA polymerase-3 subunit delta
MYKSEFDRLLQSPLGLNGYLFHGEDDYLSETYGLKVAQILANGDDITKLYFDEYKFDIAHDFLSQSSLFSSTNILFIKVGKKIPKKDLDKLLGACSTNPDSKVVISALGEGDFRSMESSFSKKTNGVAVRFYKLKDYEAINFLQEQIKQIQLTIDNATLEFLYNMHQKNLGLCVSDLQKLSILNEPINAKTVSLHCFGLGSVSIEDFLEKLVTRKPINKDLYNILEEGFNEIQLVTRITQYVQMLFMVNSYLKLHGELNIKEIWGYNLPKPIAQNYANISMQFKQKDFCDMLNYLSELELELKSGKVLDLNSFTQASLRKFLR